jgi:ABC transport system ATP-binding/permease protein
VVVTHDRYLLSRVCHGFIGLNGQGAAHYYADYEQWESDLCSALSAREKKIKETKPEKPQSQSPRPAQKKLSYLDQREYDQIEPRILAAEEQLQACQKAMEDPQIAANSDKLRSAITSWEQAQKEVEALYARWDELEAKVKL